MIQAIHFFDIFVGDYEKNPLHQAKKQAILFPEYVNPEVSLFLFHYSYSQYKYRIIFKENYYF